MSAPGQPFPYQDYQRDVVQVKNLLQRSRLWLYLVLCIIVLAPLVSFGYYQSMAKSELEAQFRYSTLALAQTLASQLDPVQHADLLRNGVAYPAYNSMQTELQNAVQSQTEISNIYTLVLSDNEIHTVLNTGSADSFKFVQTDTNPEYLLFFKAIQQQQNWFQWQIPEQKHNARACTPLAVQGNNQNAMLCLDIATIQVRERAAALLRNSGIIAFLAFLTSLCVVYSVLQHQRQYRLSLELIQKQRDLFLNSALTDPLTGALNRRAFHIVYASAQSQLQRNLLPFALISLDIDLFKQINDHLGHDYGDQVLSALVKSIQGVLRSSDHLARLGGEEFCIICNIPDRDSALLLAEKLRLTVMTTKIPVQEGEETSLTVSLGVHIPNPGESMQDALKCADTALYAAKEAGRNQTVIFQPDL